MRYGWRSIVTMLVVLVSSCGVLPGQTSTDHSDVLWEYDTGG